LKHQGRPLYEYARSGLVIDRRPREIQVLELTWRLLAENELWLCARVSKGTYVRVLAEEIGARLGCGGHLTGLRRTAIGTLSVAQATSLADLEQLPPERRPGVLRPLDVLVRELPPAHVSHQDGRRLLHGQGVAADPELPEGLVRLYDACGCFLGVGVVGPDRRLSPRRLLATGASNSLADLEE
jgi:tRNA pseudouridine55 synthase